MTKLSVVLLSVILAVTGCSKGAGDAASTETDLSSEGSVGESFSGRTEIPRAEPKTLPAEESVPETEPEPEPTASEDILILFTGNMQSDVNAGLGLSKVAKIKKDLSETNKYVTLIDCGDALQGDAADDAMDAGSAIEIMNNVGYELSAVGDHEFDEGMDSFRAAADAADFEYLSCNLIYMGPGEELNVKPYTIVEYGDTKVAFIGVTTPNVLTEDASGSFKEDDEIVYDLCAGDGNELFDRVMENVEEVRGEGVDYVVLLSHLGIEDEVYGAGIVAANTEGIDVILDSRSDCEGSERILENKNGENVILAQPGSKLASVGLLTITAGGNISASMISEYPQKDEDTQKMIDRLVTPES